MAKKKTQQPKVISNRRARYDYVLGDSFIGGLELNGREVKALRMGHGHLRGSYITVKEGELWLINATITGVSGVKLSESEQTQARKVLAKRREINALIESKQQGQTIVPLEILTQGRFIKLRIAIGKGKKHYDKREVIKKREQDRQTRAALKYRP